MEATISVGDRIGARLPEGTIDRWEISSVAMEYVAATQKGTLTAIKAGNVIIWGYINGWPKLFQFNIIGQGVYQPHDKVITSQDFTMYVGDQVTATISDGEITKWEISNFNKEYISASGGTLTALKAGNINVWGYIGSSPKLFTITIKKR